MQILTVANCARSTASSDMAIDDFALVVETEAPTPKPQVPPTPSPTTLPSTTLPTHMPTSMPTQTMVPTLIPTSEPPPGNCNFEDGFCSYSNLVGYKFWTRGSGSTPSSDTGPSSGSSGSYYMVRRIKYYPCFHFPYPFF